MNFLLNETQAIYEHHDSFTTLSMFDSQWPTKIRFCPWAFYTLFTSLGHKSKNLFFSFANQIK